MATAAAGHLGTYPSRQTPSISVWQSSTGNTKQNFRKSPSRAYLNSEDLLEEIKLKKMKLHCKDEMERIASRIVRSRSNYTQ